MANKRLDLTTGKPTKQILLFSLPLVLGSLFQQLYSFVDTIMVGRLISSEALAAVAPVSPFLWPNPSAPKTPRIFRNTCGTAAGSV